MINSRLLIITGLVLLLSGCNISD
ncbi:lipoprotein [Snodgrassella sp. B3882]|nr:lipoprotein [Snodgrassella sp. B3882]